jgi:hypothetical protein
MGLDLGVRRVSYIDLCFDPVGMVILRAIGNVVLMLPRIMVVDDGD